MVFASAAHNRAATRRRAARPATTMVSSNFHNFREDRKSRTEASIGRKPKTPVRIVVPRALRNCFVQDIHQKLPFRRGKTTIG
jgi:hypothetical protein